jgi:NADH:ubiquinone oxidoreductase subunit 5 (subunit L)/multisubunit Na+/H+ antiporter MnhA subunit
VVIHGAGGREGLADLRGLGRFFAYSRWGFLIGSLALIGTPIITAGSFSKDAIVDAAITSSTPVIGWLLLASVLLTGAYIGRLFAIVYMAPARDAHAVHHDPDAERPMNWSLVPLMVGSIILGWVGLLWFPSLLPDTLVGPLDLPPLLNLTGGLAFILGAIGFLGTAWYVLRPTTRLARGETSYRPDGWVRALAAAGYAASAAVSRAQSGLLGIYAFGSLLGISIILLVRVLVR